MCVFVVRLACLRADFLNQKAGGYPTAGGGAWGCWGKQTCMNDERVEGWRVEGWGALLLSGLYACLSCTIKMSRSQSRRFRKSWIS